MEKRYPLLNGLSSEELDLITIQLSENALDLSTFELDFEELIRYVKKLWMLRF